MKRSVITIIIFTCILTILPAQYKVVPNKPFNTLNSNPGFISINEITGGFGLKGKSAPYSKYYWGFTSVNGYQVNRNFFFGGGIGVYSYESGLLMPLFIDFRFAFNVGQITPYVFADGGLLMNFSNFDGTKLFINPGVGARYTLTRKLAINLGAGFMSQVDGTVRETFVNFKLGVFYTL